MAIPRCIHDASGHWKGTTQLHLSHLPPDQQVSASPSELRVDAHGTYATIAYAWSHEGEPHEGTMLLAMDDESKAAQIGWTDSFHYGTAVMHLVGTEAESGVVETKGLFSAGEESWGWTIALELSTGALTLSMDVVPPGGAADWAVRAVYTRA